MGTRYMAPEQVRTRRVESGNSCALTCLEAMTESPIVTAKAA